MTTDRAPLFRKAVLERLSTSDRLDQTLSVSSAKGWLALAMLGGMAAAIFAWSILGEMSTFVPARGILLGRGGVIVDAVSTGSGSLTEVVAAVGDRVEEGAVVAVVVDAEAEELHRTAVALVEENVRALAALRAARQTETAVRAENLARRRRRYETMEESARNSVEAAREFLEATRLFVAEGLVTRVDLEQSQRAFDNAQRELFAILREREDLEYDEVRRLHDEKAEIAEQEASLEAAQRAVSELAARLATHEILAPASGRVAEIKAAVGAVLSAGVPVLSIQPATDSLEALIYVAPGDGKRVVPGMEVLVSPAGARKEEYGAIRGRVADIAAFPATLQGMVAVLQSSDLAEAFSSDGPPYAGRVALETDPSTASGFGWTSSRGEALTVSSGTLVDVEIKVESRPPITLVAPVLRQFLDG